MCTEGVLSELRVAWNQLTPQVKRVILPILLCPNPTSYFQTDFFSMKYFPVPADWQFTMPGSLESLRVFVGHKSRKLQDIEQVLGPFSTLVGLGWDRGEFHFSQVQSVFKFGITSGGPEHSSATGFQGLADEFDARV